MGCQVLSRWPEEGSGDLGAGVGEVSENDLHGLVDLQGLGVAVDEQGGEPDGRVFLEGDEAGGVGEKRRERLGQRVSHDRVGEERSAPRDRDPVDLCASAGAAALTRVPDEGRAGLAARDGELAARGRLPERARAFGVEVGQREVGHGYSRASTSVLAMWPV